MRVFNNLLIEVNISKKKLKKRMYKLVFLFDRNKLGNDSRKNG